MTTVRLLGQLLSVFDTIKYVMFLGQIGKKVTKVYLKIFFFFIWNILAIWFILALSFEMWKKQQQLYIHIYSIYIYIYIKNFKKLIWTPSINMLIYLEQD